MHDLTIFVITTGERSLNKCMESIERQNVCGKSRPKVEIIKDVYPVSEAFNQMHKRCKTAYFIQVDADVILNPDALSVLYGRMKKTNFMVYATYGQLYEEGFGLGGSVRCWKKSIFNIFKFRDVRTTDRDFYKRAILLGFHRKDVKKVLGVHKPRQSDFLDYWKTKGDVEKWQYLRRPFKKYAEGLYRDLTLEVHKNRYKILGFLMGLATSKERIQRSKNTLHEQIKVNSIFEFLQSDFRKFALPRKVGFSQLLEVAKSSYLDYLPDNKKSLINSIFEQLFDKKINGTDLEKAYHILTN